MRKYLAVCGSKAVAAAIVLALLIIFNDAICDVMDATLLFFSGDMFSGFHSFFKVVGALHYSVGICTAIFYGWMICAWFKLNQNESTLELSYRFRWLVEISYIVSFVVICSYGFCNRGTTGQLMMGLFAAVWLSYVFTTLLNPKTFRPNQKATNE